MGGGQNDNDDDHGWHRKLLMTTARGGTANASEGWHGKMTTARGDTRRRVESTNGHVMMARRFTARGGNGEGHHRVERSLRVGWRNLFSSCAVVSVFCSGGK